MGHIINISILGDEKKNMKNEPNIIVIMADQLRYDALGDHTPNINKIKNDSVKFENAYCASPLCVPARGAFFTGKYPNVNGALHNAKIPQESHRGTVKKEHTNLYQILEEKWDSWHTGKMDFYTENEIHKDPSSKTTWLPLEPRYYEFLDKNGKERPGGKDFKGVVPELVNGKNTRTSVVSTPKTGLYKEGENYFYDKFIFDDTLHAINKRDRSKPFLLNAMFFAPHPPLDIPDPWYSLIEKVELPKNVGEWGNYQSPLQLYNLTGIMGANKSREDWREIWRVYMGLVALLDHYVGKVIEKLKYEGIYDNSIIIFTSDHGEMLGSHRLWQKMCMYEESIKTPLFIKFPKGEEPEVYNVSENVSSVDIVPTLCDYVGEEIPENVSGISLMPLLYGKNIKRERIFVQYDGNGSSGNFSRCVKEGDYKLIVDFFKDELFIELYDLKEDPQEMNNRALEPYFSEMVKNMLYHLRMHMIQTGDHLNLPTSAYENFVHTFDK